MTRSASQPSSDSATPRIGVPGASSALFISAVLLIVIGFFILMSASSRHFFLNAPEQAVLGAAMLATGVLCLLCTFVLVGVREIVQRQTEILLQAKHAEQQGPGEAL